MEREGNTDRGQRERVRDREGGVEGEGRRGEGLRTEGWPAIRS